MLWQYLTCSENTELPSCTTLIHFSLNVCTRGVASAAVLVEIGFSPACLKPRGRAVWSLEVSPWPQAAWHSGGGDSLPQNSAWSLKLALAACGNNRIELNELFTCLLCNSNPYPRDGSVLAVVCRVAPTHAAFMQVSSWKRGLVQCLDWQ